MSCNGAILYDEWRNPEVLPGGYVAILTPDEDLALAARVAGFQLRDTLLILGPGNRTSFGFLFRSPPEGTVIESTLKHGTGLMNINTCRVKADLTEFFSATGKPRSGLGHAEGFGMVGVYGGDKANPPNKGGRWPTNMVLVHGTGCRLVGTRTVTTGVAHRTNGGGKTFGGNVDKPPMEDLTYAGQDGKETIPAYDCEPTCPVWKLDVQSGTRVSTLTGRADPKLDHDHPSSAKTESWFSGGKATESRVYADTGGASRFYPQFPSKVELIEWVKHLIAMEVA